MQLTVLGLIAQSLTLQLEQNELLRRISKGEYRHLAALRNMSSGQHGRDQHSLYWDPAGLIGELKASEEELQEARAQLLLNQRKLEELQEEIKGCLEALSIPS